jgi:excisionase family DNA binding protein
MTESMASHHGREHDQPPATMSIEEAARLLGIGRSSCYRAAHDGRIPVIIIGRRLLVVTAKLYDMLGLDRAGAL